MTSFPATGPLPQMPVDPLPAGPRDSSALVRPGDFVSALTGVALCFFSLVVFAVSQWQYVGAEVERASVLGWVAPLIAGVLCLVAAAGSVGLRLLARRSTPRSADAS